MNDDELFALVELFDRTLMRPIWVYRSAKAQLDRPGSQGLGAKKRMLNAAKQIDQIVLDYMEDRRRVA